MLSSTGSAVNPTTCKQMGITFSKKCMKLKVRIIGCLHVSHAHAILLEAKCRTKIDKTRYKLIIYTLILWPFHLAVFWPDHLSECQTQLNWWKFASPDLSRHLKLMTQTYTHITTFFHFLYTLQQHLCKYLFKLNVQNNSLNKTSS